MAPNAYHSVTVSQWFSHLIPKASDYDFRGPSVAHLCRSSEKRRGSRSLPGMRAFHVLGESVAQGAPAAGNGAQFGHDAGGGFIVARILDDAQLALHPEPVHGYRLILPEQAPAIGTTFREIRVGIQSPTPLSSYAQYAPPAMPDVSNGTRTAYTI